MGGDAAPEDPFLSLFHGLLKGMLTEELHRKTAARLPRDRTWYRILPQAEGGPTCEPLPGEVVAAEFAGLVEELAALTGLRRGTGWTFVGERGGEWLVKVFNPQQCGSGCGDYTPPVWRVYSTLEPSPAALAAITPPPPDPSRFEAFAARARRLLGR
ncbi:MAG: hypothetical protein D6739_09395 [Nitrospirae bacterium]|nr:MAG: hypothetical protein D6739_09395 [Nitrospirota bacterium]